MSILYRSVQDLKGVGPQLAAKLAKLQIKTLQDVLFHLPRSYVDRTRIYPLHTVRVDELVVIEGTIEKVSVIPKPKRNLVIRIRDNNSTAELRFFHFNAQQLEQFVLGKKVRCFGQARHGRTGLQFIHPEYRIFAPEHILPVEEYLTPIYPATDGIGQKLLRTLVLQVLDLLKPLNESLEILPKNLREELEFGSLLDNLQQIHFPTPECYTHVLNQGYHPAQRRLAFEELLAHHLSLRQKRQLAQRDHAFAINHQGSLAEQLRATLTFTLTNAQDRAIEIIRNDLQQDYPMLRLIQGDVGSGKTLVAVMSALFAIEAGLQVAFMAPTEILAEQHYANIKKWFAVLGLTVCCLWARVNPKEKIAIKQQIANGEIQLVIGTHALFQDDVVFQKLGLVIIDEQHKFGVAQRLALQKKGQHADFAPHQLILTATPIPRTLAMTFYADLDYAVIDELPPGRKPITTLVVSDRRRTEILERIVNICGLGQQVYWVCTLISESEVIDSKAAELAFAELQQLLPQLKVELIHARLPTDAKEHIMDEFKQGRIHVLVATTVIEVGVDVPNASLMVIENPERLGLAQLHQLRGRVGRGASQSYCVLLYKSPLGQKAMQRLEFMRQSQDGFAIAEFDLQLRGPGEVFGTRQSGLASLRIADLVRDQELLPAVAQASDLILREHSLIIPNLLQRWMREQAELINV